MNGIPDFFCAFGYTAAATTPTRDSAVSTFSNEWVSKYFDNNFAQIDPIYHFADQTKRTNAAYILTAADMASPLFEEAAIYGANSNVMVTDHFAGSQFVLGGVNFDIRAQHLPDLQRVCKVEHRRAIARRIARLTDSQTDFLTCFEMGLGETETAYELGISRSAVSQRKRAICTTLDVTQFKAAVQLYSAYLLDDLIAGQT